MTKPLIAVPAPASTGAGARGARRGGAAAVGLVLGGAVSVQAGAAVAALLFPRAGVAGVVTLRLVIAALLLLVVCRPRLRGHTARDWLVVGAFGVALAGMNALIYQAIERIPLGVAVTVEVLGPLVLSVITGRRASSWLWAALALGGVVLLGRGGVDGLDPVGVGFAIGAAAMWAAYILLSARTGTRFPKANGLALAMTVAAILTLPWGVTASGAALLDPVTAGLGAAVAVLSSVLPYTLELLALRRMPTSTFAVLMSLSPAIAALAGYLVLDQALAPVQLLAIGLVIAASAGAVHTSNNNGLRLNPARTGAAFCIHPGQRQDHASALSSCARAWTSRRQASGHSPAITDASVDQVLALTRRLPDAGPPPAPDQVALDHILAASGDNPGSIPARE